jgi:hypothetical protein
MKLDGGATAGEIAQHDGWHTGVGLLGWSNLVVVVEVAEDGDGAKKVVEVLPENITSKKFGFGSMSLGWWLTKWILDL